MSYSRTTYSRLFSKIGTTWGAGDRNTTFNVPNFNAKTVWQSSTLGVGYTDKGKIPNITGNFPSVPGIGLTNGYSGAFSDGNAVNNIGSGGNFYGVKNTIFDASKVSDLYTSNIEAVIPSRNVVKFCIRY